MRAAKIFQYLNAHQIVSDGVRIAIGIRVDSGEIAGFRTSDGSCGVLIPISEVESRNFKSDKKSPSIQLTRMLEESTDGTTRPFARLALLEPFHEKVFSIFVDELLTELSHHPIGAAEKTGLMLQRWRRLFSAKPPSGTFGREKQIGLLCELEVLKVLIEELGGEAISRWTGPEALPHDFELAEESIECKATTSVNGMRIGINGTNQLVETPGKMLRLVVRRYIPNPDGKLSVPDLCRMIYENYSIPIEEFLEKLDKIGCPVFHPDGDTEFFRFDSEVALEFSVKETFPKVPHRGLNTRISHVQYTLDLSGPELIPGFQVTNRYLKE